MVIKMGRFGKFLACPGFPECKNAKPLVEKMPGRCPKCGSGMLKKKSKKGYAYYACEKGADCGFMSWDVPTAEDCPECGFTLFKKSGKGRMKPCCINETCSKFLPEDQRGYYKKKTATEGTEGEPAGEPGPAETAEKKTAAKKTAAKKPATKKTAAKKTTAGKKSAPKKTAEKKTTAKKTTASKAKKTVEANK
jgi:DNA topoisomerase-1